MIIGAKTMRLRRSVLFMPASNRSALGKASGFDCDSVIFDLEDSVSREEQENARLNLLELVKGADFGRLETIIRVCASETCEYSTDVLSAVECRPDAILLPKVETGAMISDLRQMLDYCGAGSIQIWAMIETPRGLVNLKEIASCKSGLEVLVVGPNDLARETGVAMVPGRRAMVPWMMDIIVHARANGLGVLDGVFNNFRDCEGFKIECRQGALMGFDGKTLIHPAQIDIANLVFSPTEDAIARALRIVSLFAEPENAGKSALQMDGEMVEVLHLNWAKQLLELNDLITKRGKT